jgi:hypothetical protein
MNRQTSFALRIFTTAVVFLLLTGASVRAAEKELKLEALLVLGSNDPQAKGTLVSPEIEKKLKRLPLKWGRYFVTNSQQFLLGQDGSKDVRLSRNCQISVTNLGGERVKLNLMDGGQNLGKVTQSLKKGQVLVVGGNAENMIVVLRQMD